MTNKSSSGLPIGASHDPDAPFNQPDEEYTTCPECGKEISGIVLDDLGIVDCSDHLSHEALIERYRKLRRKMKEDNDSLKRCLEEVRECLNKNSTLR